MYTPPPLPPAPTGEACLAPGPDPHHLAHPSAPTQQWTATSTCGCWLLSVMRARSVCLERLSFVAYCVTVIKRVIDRYAAYPPNAKSKMNTFWPLHTEKKLKKPYRTIKRFIGLSNQRNHLSSFELKLYILVHKFGYNWNPNGLVWNQVSSDTEPAICYGTSKCSIQYSLTIQYIPNGMSESKNRLCNKVNNEFSLEPIRFHVKPNDIFTESSCSFKNYNKICANNHQAKKTTWPMRPPKCGPSDLIILCYQTTCL